jgi:hypothetical protein
MNGLSFRFANFGNHRHSLPLPSLRSVALSVTLLPGAALLVTSFVRLSQQNIEFILKIVGSVLSRCRQRNIPIRLRARDREPGDAAGVFRISGGIGHSSGSRRFDLRTTFSNFRP